MAQADKTGGPRRQAITLLIQLARRAVDAVRSYGATHPLASGAVERVREHLSGR